MSHFNGTEHNRPVHFSSRESHTAGREESCPVHSTLLLPSFATACHRFIFNRAPHTMTPGAAHFAALLSCLLLSYHSSSSSSSSSSFSSKIGSKKVGVRLNKMQACMKALNVFHPFVGGWGCERLIRQKASSSRTRDRGQWTGRWNSIWRNHIAAFCRVCSGLSSSIIVPACIV